jgi:hypothetical protein
MQDLSPRVIQRGLRKPLLLLVMTVAGLQGLRGTLDARANIADVSRYAELIVVADNTWSDELRNMSNLSALEDVIITTTVHASPAMMVDNAFPITTAPKTQKFPVVAYNANTDQFLVAWIDLRDLGGGTHVYGRRLTSDGTLLGPELAINVGTASQHRPAITARTGFPEYLVHLGINKYIATQQEPCLCKST